VVRGSLIPVEKSKQNINDGEVEKFKKLLQIEQMESKKLRQVSSII